jgi:aquaglyceroporin related protein, other eukaryote
VPVLCLGSEMVEIQDVPDGEKGDHAIETPGEHEGDATLRAAPVQQNPYIESPRPAAIPTSPPQHLHPNEPSGIRRSGTLPAISRNSHSRHRDPQGTRRRGATVASRNAETSPLARSPLGGVNNPSDHAASQGDRMNPIPEADSRRVSEDSGFIRRDRSTNSGRPRFSSQGTRPRVGTWTSSAAPRPRGSTLSRRRPSVAIAPVSSGGTGNATGAQSQADFSLAGPPPEVALQSNQPYVDPGYTELNPAYDQPSNIRPVWGLAKPLPRVLRPGMVPSQTEIPEQPQDPGPDLGNVDVELGRIEPTLRLGKISSQLQNARQNRENQLVRSYSRKGEHAASNLGPTTSGVIPLSPPSEVIDESEDSEDFGPFPSLEGRQRVFSSGGQRRKRPSREGWYPDNAYSITTEPDEHGYSDGDDLNAIPLKAYEGGDDEVHNLHTHWSVIRLRFREPLAELLAVCIPFSWVIMLTLLGYCPTDSWILRRSHCHGI